MRSKEVKYKGMRRIRKTRLCNRNAIKKRVTEHNVKKHNVLKQNVTNIIRKNKSTDMYGHRFLFQTS